MHINVAIDQLKGVISYFKAYRETRYTSAMISSKEIAIIMEIEHIFCEKHIIHKKKNGLMRILMTRQHNLLKNLLELIASYI
jgi:hypothetical protein